MQPKHTQSASSVRGFLLDRLRHLAGEGLTDTPPCPTPHQGAGDTPHITPHIPALYREWRNDLLAGRKVLPAREGRLWLHQRVRLQRRLEISAPAVDGLLRAFRRRAFNDGHLLLNPYYTGKAPYPQFVRVVG